MHSILRIVNSAIISVYSALRIVHKLNCSGELEFVQAVAAREAENKMNSTNLGTVLHRHPLSQKTQS